MACSRFRDGSQLVFRVLFSSIFVVAGAPAAWRWRWAFSRLEPGLRAAREAGVIVVACGLTLTEKRIERATLSADVRVVENGIVEALQRQKDGYRSVEL